MDSPPSSNGHHGAPGNAFSSKVGSGASYPTTPSIYQSQGPGPGPGAGGLDWRQLGQSLLERLWVIVLLTLTGLFLALGYLAKSPRLYQSRIVLEVQAQDPSLVDVGAGQGGPRPGSLGGMFGMASQEALRTVEQNLRNRALMVRVLRSEGLTGAEGGRALFGTEASPTDNKAPAAAPSEEALAGALSGMVGATVRRGTRLIDLQVTNRDPALARRLAEAVGREYIRASIERRHDFAQEALRFLVQEAERLKSKLQTSEKAVSDYKASNPDALALGGGAASTGSGGTTTTGRGGVTESRLEDLSNKLTAAKTERMRTEETLAQVDRILAASPRGGGTEALLGLPAIASAPAVAERRRELGQIQGAVAALAQRYKDKHPRMIAARAALEQAQAALAQTVASQPALLRSVVESAQATENALGSASKDQEQAALALNRAAIPYQELARQVDTDRALYENVLRQIKQTDLAKEANRSDAVSIIEHASTPGGPVSPQPPKTVAAGVIGGLASGLGLVMLLNLLDRSVKTVDQAESLSGLPVLAAVPELTRGEKPGKVARKRSSSDEAESAATRSVLASSQEGPVTEAFRSLRAALSLLGPEADRRVFLFTSALPSEGKSFTSANYALSLAQQGHRVLLIDGDLRRPSLHRVFGLANGDGDPATRGLVDYLIGGVMHGGRNPGNNGHPVESRPTPGEGEAPAVSELARPVTMTLPGVVVGNRDGGQLFVMTAGSRSPNPAELLSSGGGAGIRRLIEEALTCFDRVVIDSAPVLAVSDTLLLLPYVQTTCVVVRAKKTARNALVRTLALLGQAQAAVVGHDYLRQHSISGGAVAPCAGLVLNRLPRRRGLGYYYYYSEHGYGYGAEPSPSQGGARVTREAQSIAAGDSKR